MAATATQTASITETGTAMGTKKEKKEGEGEAIVKIVIVLTVSTVHSTCTCLEKIACIIFTACIPFFFLIIFQTSFLFNLLLITLYLLALPAPLHILILPGIIFFSYLIHYYEVNYFHGTQNLICYPV